MEFERKPWWVSDVEKKGLRTTPVVGETPAEVRESGKEIARGVEDGIPQLEKVELERVTVEYGVKDDLLNYHFYLTPRLKLYTEAQEALEQIRNSDLSARDKDFRQKEISATANQALAEHPWPNNIDKTLGVLFLASFPNSRFKLDYVSEADSWSLITPVPTKGMDPLHKVADPIHALERALGGG